MTVPLAIVLVLAGCSGQPENQAPQPTVTTSTTSSTPVTTTAATTTAVVDRTARVCELVDAAAFSHLFAQGMAIGRYKDGAQLRTATAGLYEDFAARLGSIANHAEGALRTALIEWAATSTEVGQYVAKTKPKRGIVIEYGPAHPRSQAAEKAAEAVCGHDLPKLNQ